MNITTELSKLTATIQAATAELQAAYITPQKEAIVRRFADEGRVPRGSDGTRIPDATLMTFSVGELQRLLANIPSTIPPHARRKAAGGDGRSDLKGLDRVRSSFAHRVRALAGRPN